MRLSYDSWNCKCRCVEVWCRTLIYIQRISSKYIHIYTVASNKIPVYAVGSETGVILFLYNVILYLLRCVEQIYKHSISVCICPPVCVSARLFRLSFLCLRLKAPEALCFRVVCPSVRPKPEIPSFDLYMGPLVHRTNRNRFTACPSVRPERFPGICRRMHGGIGLKFYMLMYLDHLQNWLVHGCGLLIFLILALFYLVKRVRFGVSGHFPENARREWPGILHADISWPPSELITLRPQSVDFCNFGTILT